MKNLPIGRIILCLIIGALLAGFFVGMSDPASFILGTIGTTAALLLIPTRKRKAQPFN